MGRITANQPIIVGERMFPDLGRGDKSLFWLDRWAGNRPLNELFPNLYAIESEKRCRVLDRYKLNQGNIEWFWGSSNDLSTDAVKEEWAECLALVSRVSIRQTPDVWRWKMEDKLVDFQVSLVREELDDISLVNETKVLNWLHWIPKKVNCFPWRVVLDRIATKEALQIRRLQLTSVNCVMCNGELESVNHLLITCEWAQQIWSVVFQWMKIQLPRYILSVVQLLEFIDSYKGEKKFKRAVYTVVAATCWIIWRMRNEVIFKNKSPTLVKAIGDIKSTSFSWVYNRSGLLDMSWDLWRSFSL
ncbi:uncharacterized protein LOC110924000 [Helianthus annuus]|uniref:uncharacterized protein LOC110924000 n=1 Tax=Helianthus annuus TaxID=4232 RepID=UPI000B902B11|nr:uncharacterized protein LOC110924000 [Helianthus annuus]